MQDSTSRTDQEGRDSVKDSLDDTYFLLWRSILDKPHFADPNLLKVWVWCLAKASYKSRCLPVRTGRGTTTVNIQRGQFLYGRKAAAEELNMPEGSVRDRMQRLQELESIAIQPDTHFSIVSVVNFDLYQPVTGKRRQASRQPNDNQQPGNRRATTTNNECQKDTRGKGYGTVDGDGAMCAFEEKARARSRWIKDINAKMRCKTPNDRSLCVKVAWLVGEGKFAENDIREVLESFDCNEAKNTPPAWFHDCCSNKAAKYGANFHQWLAQIDIDQADIDQIFRDAFTEQNQ